MSSHLPENLYGALMMRGDLDILEEVMDCNHRYFRGIFVLDGTDPWQDSKRILDKYPNIDFYIRDEDLGPDYHKPLKDGARQVLLEAIQKKYGTDGYIFNLHSDEMYFDIPPRVLAAHMYRAGADVAVVRNVHFFLHSSMRDTYVYDPDASVVNQVPFACFPGWPEHRVYKNRPQLKYDKNHHSSTVPGGLEKGIVTGYPVRHYIYRSEVQMKQNALDRWQRKWQNYGFEWMKKNESCYVDCLPGYQFTRHIPAGRKILNGATGELAN